ncbi:MAG: IS1380 family transposase [Geminicoccales bacterium]
MSTECSPESYDFGRVEGRRLVADFGGGTLTSNGGALLLRQVAKVTGLLTRLAGCFTDHRAEDRVEYGVPTLLGQRLFGLALGSEDLNDHDELRHDPLLAACLDRLGGRRKDCAALAGRNTLGRLERSPSGSVTRYHKISHDPAAIERVLVELFLGAKATPPDQIILDLDASDIPLHGDQEGKFFHGYYGHYCYLPLYIFCDEHLLAAKLRPANIDGAAGAVEEVERIVAQIRDTWPSVRIILRADSGFARDELMTWAEDNKVDYLFGLAKTKRLITKIRPELDLARAEMEASGVATRVFADFTWSTLKSWSTKRRVVGKAEILPPTTEAPRDPKKPNLGKANPRFVVTTINAEEHDAQTLYEKLYCARGDMENRIKDKQLDLFGTRMSAASMRANQLRLWFSGFAYTLIKALQRIALVGTTLENAGPQRIRLSLLKIAAQITLSARRLRAAMTSACPHKAEFTIAYQRLAELKAF